MRWFRCFLCLVLFAGVAQAQSGLVKGVVTDAETGEPLPGANVMVQNLKLGAVSDGDGRFVITGLEAGEHKLEVSYIGYETVMRTVSLAKRLWAFVSDGAFALQIGCQHQLSYCTDPVDGSAQLLRSGALNT